VRNAIAAAVHEFGSQGCAERVAQEFGDHPETAVVRMRWARVLAGEACRSCFARCACVRAEARTGMPRSGSSPATQRPMEPGPPPAAPVTSTSPPARALLSVHGVKPNETIISEVDTCKNKV
jgi:hypothetical protein